MSLLIALISTALAAGPTASSTKDGLEGKLPASFAFDGMLQTAWAEGASGYGENEWLELDLGRATQIDTLSIWPGNLTEGAKSYREFSRPKLVRVQVDGKDVGQPVRLLDELQRADIPVGVQGRKVRVVVDEVFEGIVFSDMAITEVAINFTAEEHPTNARLERWFESRDAGRLADKFNQTTETMYKRNKEAEFGDAEALAWLADAAADGADFIRPRVQSLVAPGFRAQAVRSSKKARVALQKSKDANAIPSLELAALRAHGAERVAREEVVEIFYAYQELIGGGNRNVPYWGQTGWETGAIQSFGEPIPLEIDRFGAVYLADTGNNRLQKYAEDGRPEKTFGPEPDLASEWFGKGRKWYVSGSAPGEGALQWRNPLDVALIPGKESDAVAGLDAMGKLQIYDGEGRPVISWDVQTKRRAEPQLGGQGYLGYVEKKGVLIAVMKYEAVVYNLDSEELSRWEIEDGTPNALEVLPNGKILMAFGDSVVQYNHDGFRHGEIIGADTFGPGFEDMDLTVDEKGKLWAITDTGRVIKFKKPGKVDFSLKAIDRPLDNPRIAVQEGLLYLAADDKVEIFDISQIRMDQAAAAAEAGE